MTYRYYSADRVRDKMPQFKGTDEELQSQLDKLDLMTLERNIHICLFTM